MCCSGLILQACTFHKVAGKAERFPGGYHGQSRVTFHKAWLGKCSMSHKSEPGRAHPLSHACHEAVHEDAITCRFRGGSTCEAPLIEGRLQTFERCCLLCCSSGCQQNLLNIHSVMQVQRGTMGLLP